MAAQKAKIPQAMEDYLVAIYVLEREGLSVISARVAEHVGVSPVTMHEMVRRLIQSGYVTVDRKKQLRLTPEGQQAAESVYRRHTLAERLMTDVLGLDWAEAMAARGSSRKAKAMRMGRRTFVKTNEVAKV